MKEKRRLNKQGTIYHWFSRLWKRFTQEQWRLVNERYDLHTTGAPRGKKKTFHSMTKTNIETILMASRGGSRCVCLQCQSNGCAILFGLLQVDYCWYVWLWRAFCYHSNFPWQEGEVVWLWCIKTNNPSNHLQVKRLLFRNVCRKILCRWP